MKRILVVFGVVAVVVGMAIWFIGSHGNDAEGEPEQVTVEVIRGPLVVTVSATGVLEPLTTVEVKSRSGGEVSKMYVEPGDYVEAGQIIAQLDPTELQGKVDQARAQADVSQARLSQTRLNNEVQGEQTATALVEAQASLASAQARLKQAQAQETIQPQLTEADLTQARAGLTRAEQDLAILLAGARPQEVAQARTRVIEAQAAADNAQATLMREEALLAKGFVSQQSVEDARRAHTAAAAQLESSQQNLSLVEAGPRPEEIERSRAGVQQAQAALAAAEAQTIQVDIRRQERASAEATVLQAEAGLRRAKAGELSDAARAKDIQIATAELRRSQSQLDEVEYSFEHSTIVAPRNGVVLEKLVEEGTVVPAGTAALAQGTTIVTLADITEMYVLVEVDEADIAQVEVGQTAEITVDALPTHAFAGNVVKVFPKASEEQNVIYFPVRVKLLDTSRQLRPGMTADVTLVVAEQEDTLLIPDSAIDRSGMQPTVQVLEAPQAEPVERPVKVGISDWELTEILEGLKEGERVALPAGANPPPGMGGNGAHGRTGQRALRMLGRAGRR